MNFRREVTFFALLLCIFLIGDGCTREGSESQSKHHGVTAENPVQTINDVQTLIQQGNGYMDSRRYLDAAKSYAQALAITPENADVLIDLGTCYRKMGRPEKAVHAYRKALNLQPDHPNGLANLGVVLAYDLKDLNGAVVVWEKFLSQYPNHQMAASIRQEVQRIKEAKGAVTDNKS